MFVIVPFTRKWTVIVQIPGGIWVTAEINMIKRSAAKRGTFICVKSFTISQTENRNYFVWQKRDRNGRCLRSICSLFLTRFLIPSSFFLLLFDSWIETPDTSVSFNSFVSFQLQNHSYQITFFKKFHHFLHCLQEMNIKR